jgi:hypothetical protein
MGRMPTIARATHPCLPLLSPYIDIYIPSDKATYSMAPPNILFKELVTMRSGNELTCNGTPGNCYLPYTSLTMPGTHNSVATHLPMPCFFVDQPGHTVAEQLLDGIRDFDIDTCESDGQVWACHWPFISGRMDEHMETIQAFLDANPREIVSINYDDANGDLSILAEAVWGAALETFGDRIAVRPAKNGTWPTVGEMIEADKRVVIYMSWGFFDGMPGIANETRIQSTEKSYEKSWPHAARDSQTTREFVQHFAEYCEVLLPDSRRYAIDLE